MGADSPSGSRRIRVLIVDDHPAVCQGLALLLESDGIAVSAEAAGPAEALERLAECRPDVALVDLSLGDDDGMMLVAELHGLAVRCLAYSMHEDAWHVEGALAAGAHGYVTKREIRGVLVQAIREVAGGRRFVSPRAALALADRAPTAQANEGQRELSRQEGQVYRLLGDGRGSAEIAAVLGVSARTVESYYERIMLKLGLPGMRELRRHAISHRHGHVR